jgi:gas vesicle protein
MTDEDLDTVQDEDTAVRGGGYFAAGLIIGAMVGASAALLMAPDTGKGTRRRLQRRFHHLREEAASELRDAGRAARREFRRRIRDI